MKDQSIKTKLHYTDVLTVTDGRLVSKNGMEGVRNACNALIGPGVTTMSLLLVMKPCGEELKKMLPAYTNPKVVEAVDAAISEWKITQDDGGDLQIYLNEYALPLLGEEYVEVEHLSEEYCDKLMEAYGAFLKEMLKDKNVVGIQLSKE